MALEGNLQDMSLVDLFQIFRMGPKTGILLLLAGQERGVVYVAAGRLVDAALVHGAERQVIASGEDAVIQLLQWEDASFTFRHDPAVSERPSRIFHDSDWLILEGMRRRENPLRMLPHQSITMDTQLELAALPSSVESGVSLDLDQWRILSQIAISKNMREICTKTAMEPDQAIHTVTELIAIGLVEIVQPKLAVPAPRRDRVIQPSQQLRPAAVGIGGEMAVSTSAPPTTPARGLLNAIMRRVRGL